MDKKTKTLKVRVRDKHAAELSRMARAANYVWNFQNELSHRAIAERGIFLSGYDIQKYTNGAGKELGLHSGTVQQIAAEYATRRKQFKKNKLAWRKSFGVRRSLGWIPIKTGHSKWKNGQVYHNGTYFKVWDSYGLAEYKFHSATFNEDARGRWYFNVVVKCEPEQSTGIASVGLDFGCKDAATASTGEKLSGRWYRAQEEKLATAQRARKKKRAKAIHAKAANQRKDALHKFSRILVDQNAAIFVGNINAKAIAKTRLSKSSLDAGWGMLKTMLEYKSDHAGIVFEVVNEAYTTQVCSSCGCLPPERPKGIAGLGIREWTCGDCGVLHDRDVNAATNILAAGHCRLAVGIPVL